jgi:hypothetical protein
MGASNSNNYLPFNANGETDRRELSEANLLYTLRATVLKNRNINVLLASSAIKINIKCNQWNAPSRLIIMNRSDQPLITMSFTPELLCNA